MMWTEVETYRQLEQDYERALDSFKREEAAYSEASKRGPDSALIEQYERLAEKRRKLEEMHDQLRQMRNSLAHSRDEVAKTALL